MPDLNQPNLPEGGAGELSSSWADLATSAGGASSSASAGLPPEEELEVDPDADPHRTADDPDPLVGPGGVTSIGANAPEREAADS